MITKIDHIGIAVNNLEEAIKVYTEALGLKVEEIETVEEQKAKIAMIPVGESRIELLKSTSSEGAIAKHIERRGEGLHHIALRTSDIEGMLANLKEKSVQLIDEEPRTGAGGSKIAFLHPKAPKALIELVEQ